MIGPYEFPQEKVWTNGPQSSVKVSVLTGIGPWSVLPCIDLGIGNGGGKQGRDNQPP